MTEAYVTLATNDTYALGALVLGHSLLSVGTSKQLCIVITTGVSENVRSLLAGVFNNVVVVDVLDSQDSAHLALLKRPELGVTLTKLHCWTLTQYSKCVFLDADMLVVQNPDELFTYPELSAVCDVGWPDCFNSGLFVFVPSQDTYSRLLSHAESTGSFDGGDQGLLNTFFTSWTRLSFVYNMVASVMYTYLPAFKQYGSGVKLVHFLGSLKPWQQHYSEQTGTVSTPPGYQHVAPFLNVWWSLFSKLVKPKLPTELSHGGASSVPYVWSQGVSVSNQSVYQTKSLEVKRSLPLENAASRAGSEIWPSEPMSSQNSCDSYGEYPLSPCAATSPLESVPNTSDERECAENHSEISCTQGIYEQCTDFADSDLSAQTDNTSPECTEIICSDTESLLVTHVTHEVLYIDDTGRIEMDRTELTPETPVPNPVDWSEDTESNRAPVSSCVCNPSPTEVISTADYTAADKVNHVADISTEQELAEKEVTRPVSETLELTQQLSRMTVEETLEEGRARWERGEVDYTGRDSFNNIVTYIEKRLEQNRKK